MRILLIYGEGRVEEALLLGASGGRMRVMLRGLADVIEFRLVEGVWMAESGATVDLGAAFAVESEEVPQSPRALTASTWTF